VLRICAIVLVFCFVASACPFVKSYEVEPVVAQCSGWGSGYVSQVVTCNFDSLAYCELFIGASPGKGKYQLEVWDYLNGQRVALSEPVAASREYHWLQFKQWQSTGIFVKGRKYEFRFKRGSDDSINCYYHDGNPYPKKYGWMEVDSDSEPEKDLACRVYGRMNTVDSTYWGVNPGFNDWDSPEFLLKWVALAETAGVGMARCPIPWTWRQPDSSAQLFDFTGPDIAHEYIHDSACCEVLGNLSLCPKWVSTRVDSVVGNIMYWSENCAPRNLFEDIDSDSNYWARFSEATVKHFGNNVHTWEIWNEPNDNCTTNVLGVDGWWRRSNSGYYGTDTTLRGLCSLYVRLCYVANSAIKIVRFHENDRVLIGSLARVNDSSAIQSLVMGKTWLRTFYEIATGPWNLGVFWDGVSVHPYQNRPGLDPDGFEADAETLRAIMRAHGHDGELWITEMGWDTSNLLQQANDVCETFVCAKASEALPAGGYDRMCWYNFRDFGWHCGLLDSAMNVKRPSFYAFKQAGSSLTGQRFTRRVLLGDQRDDLVRVYEFEDLASPRRMWVGWKNGSTRPDGGSVGVEIPVRADALAAESLAYDTQTPAFEVRPGLDGWLSLGLNERPIFVREIGSPKRPDLVVDSVKVAPEEPKVGKVMTVRAWVRNIGNRETPEGLQTRVDFYLNGKLIGSDQSVRPIRPGETKCFESGWNEVMPEMRGSGLFSAKVNQDQRYVELEMDNNAGYAHGEIR